MTTRDDRAEINGMAYRIRVPAGGGPHPTLVMAHGYEGTEDVTWIFTKSAGLEWLIASPRAPIQAAQGFSWYNFDAEGRSEPESFRAAVEALAGFIEELAARYPVDRSRLVVLGFSQGAAVAYAYGTSHPVSGIVSLSGWMPGLVAQGLPALGGLPVLILHGTQDDVIPVAIARKNRDTLTQAGARVTYYEEEIGHKVGAVGMRMLADWLAERLANGHPTDPG